MDDQEILRLLLEHDESGIRAMTLTYGPRLLATARNILGNSADAEETVNDTYLAVWHAIPPKKPESLSAFVYRTGKNLALKLLRHRSARKRGSQYDLSLEELSGCLSGRCLEEDFEAKQLGQAIDAFLDTLTKTNRVLFLRRYWFGDSVRDLARHFAMSENTVSVRLSRIRNQLKEYLLKEEYLYE